MRLSSVTTCVVLAIAVLFTSDAVARKNDPKHTVCGATGVVVPEYEAGKAPHTTVKKDVKDEARRKEAKYYAEQARKAAPAFKDSRCLF